VSRSILSCSRLSIGPLHAFIRSTIDGVMTCDSLSSPLLFRLLMAVTLSKSAVRRTIYPAAIIKFRYNNSTATVSKKKEGTLLSYLRPFHRPVFFTKEAFKRYPRTHAHLNFYLQKNRRTVERAPFCSHQI
jgi:hypothetical protein